MHPLAISTIPTAGFNLIFGNPTFEISESSSAINFFPSNVDWITCSVFPMEFGPKRLAFSANFSTVSFSAFGKQPATTNGLEFDSLIL